MTHTSEIIRLPEVKRLTGLSRSSIYRLEARSQFPSRVRISERATGWHYGEVAAWLAARPRASLAARPRASLAARPRASERSQPMRVFDILEAHVGALKAEEIVAELSDAGLLLRPHE